MNLLRRALKHRTLTLLAVYWLSNAAAREFGGGGMLAAMIGFVVAGFAAHLLDAAVRPKPDPPLVRVGRKLERWRLIRRQTDT